MISKIKIIIVDDHPIVRRGIESLLSNYDDFDVVATADTVQTALKAVEDFAPDVVLVDIRLAGESGMDIVRTLKPSPVKVIVLTSFDNETYVETALHAGVDGYILKNASDETLCDAIRSVYAGEKVITPSIDRDTVTDAPAPEFTDEERAIMRLLVDGASNNDIAEAQYISLATAKRKLRQIFNKLDAQNRAQAVAAIMQRNLI